MHNTLIDGCHIVDNNVNLQRDEDDGDNDDDGDDDDDDDDIYIMMKYVFVTKNHQFLSA